MLATLKSEFRKILTVRSTYILVCIALFLTAFFTYLSTAPITTQEQTGGKVIQQTLPDGTKTAEPDPNDPPKYVTKVEHTLPKEKIISNLQEGNGVVALFVTVVVVLFMAHEFRYNTISYTLTASRRRFRILLSKLIVSTTFATVVALLAIGVGIAASFAAIGIKDLHLPPQDFNWLYIVSRLVGYTLGFSLLGLAIITLVRNLTAGVAAIFVLPTLNAIGAALLASRNIEPTRVLPFSALDRIGSVLRDYTPQGMPNEAFSDPQRLQASVLGATLVFLAYLVGVWIIAWVAFTRRDAN